MPSHLQRTQTEHLLEHMSDGYFLLDAQWRFSEVNDRGRQILNPPIELLGRYIWDVFPSSIGSEFQIQYEKAISTQQPVKFEVFSPRLQKWFDVRAIPLKDTGLSVFFNDISTRKQNEAHQEAAAERLEMALEASQLGTWEWILGEDRLNLSEHAIAILGLNPNSSSENFYGRFPRIVHPQDLKSVRKTIKSCIELPAPHQIEYRIVWPDQSVHWVLCRGRSVFDPASKIPVRVIGTMIDITARKQHQEELSKALQEAKSASALKSAFLANMSHEIRTPLGAILGFAEVLADPQTSAEDREQYVSIIARNGRILSRLIDDILDLSKVESGLLELETLPVSLRQTLESIWPSLELSAQTKGLPLEMTIDEKVSDQLITDPTRLSQILLNLLQNAIKFTDRGFVRLEVIEKTNFIHFHIVDTGVGIPGEQVQKLFSAFRQADESITRRYGGTGLGLALSKKLARLLGGDIDLLESHVGKGSHFQVRIPIKYKKPQPYQARVF